MFIINNKQLAQLKMFAEINYKKILCKQKAKKFNGQNKVSTEIFNKRILTNYDTARYYGFKTKREVERFIDLTFEYEDLNKPVPLEQKIHIMLRSPGKTAIAKFEMIRTYYSMGNQKSTVKNV